MEIYDVSVVKKGCSSLAKIRVVVEEAEISKETQFKLANEYAHGEVVFVMPSDQATCKFTFYINGQERLFCYIAFSAATHVLVKRYPNVKNKKSYTLEAIDIIFKADLLQLQMLEKDLKFIEEIKQAIYLGKQPIWQHHDKSINNYDADCILLEVPQFSLFAKKPVYTMGLVQSTVAAPHEIDAVINTLLQYTGKQKYRMQIKFNEESLDVLLFTLYIQDIENGNMVRIDAMSFDMIQVK